MTDTDVIYQEKPAALLEVHVHLTEALPETRGLCTGFDRKRWRNEELADYLFEYLPEFALRYSELGPEGHDTWVPKLREAAKAVYTTDKFERRGEFGELLLHAVLREIWDTEPAVSKIYYKDGTNETVKGFDAVHVALPSNGDGLELLLGEVKFYNDISSAMSDVASELQDHFGNDTWMRNEFVAVTHKVDESWPHADALRELLHSRTKLEDIISHVRVPVLLTYDSDCVGNHDECHDAYCEELSEEIADIQERFSKKDIPVDITVDLLIVPLASKKELLQCLEGKLAAWRMI